MGCRYLADTWMGDETFTTLSLTGRPDRTPNRPGSSPRDLQESFKRAVRLRGDLRKRQNRIDRQAQRLAWGLAALMDPGDFHYRLGLGIHAFDVEGRTCIPATYHDEREDETCYRYAVLCGGEEAIRALRTVPLDPGDSDEPGPRRRVALATFDEYEELSNACRAT
jgi:hypothetical protein